MGLPFSNGGSTAQDVTVHFIFMIFCFLFHRKTVIIFLHLVDRVTKQRDPESGQQSLLFEIDESHFDEDEGIITSDS